MKLKNKFKKFIIFLLGLDTILKNQDELLELMKQVSAKQEEPDINLNELNHFDTTQIIANKLTSLEAQFKLSRQQVDIDKIDNKKAFDNAKDNLIKTVRFEVWETNKIIREKVIEELRKLKSEIRLMKPSDVRIVDRDISVYDLDCSVRLKNVMRSIWGMELKLSDLVSIEKESFIKYRHAGIKTWEELQQLIQMLYNE